MLLLLCMINIKLVVRKMYVVPVLKGECDVQERENYKSHKYYESQHKDLGKNNNR